MMRKVQNRAETRGLLRAHGIAPTHQRVELAYCLFFSQAHWSADQLQAVVNSQREQTSKATVYNTLKLLLSKGLIREVIVNPKKVFYDPNTDGHHHFYDIQSGELVDIDSSGITVEGLPPLPQGVIADGVDIIVRIRRPSAAGERLPDTHSQRYRSKRDSLI